MNPYTKCGVMSLLLKEVVRFYSPIGKVWCVSIGVDKSDGSAVEIQSKAGTNTLQFLLWAVNMVSLITSCKHCHCS